MNEKDLFLTAYRLTDAVERDRYLEKVCADRPDLLKKVRELLQLSDEVGSMLELPDGSTFTAETVTPGSESVSSVIGPYKLLEPIGEGGMGTVYMAEQTTPVRRIVALKVIKAGMDSRQVLARFEAERQALAMMDHPNIAKVLDAGTTDHGRPYFVMELVKGRPITQYCDDLKLKPKQRLELFVAVCQAVQHAHQKGIIHRDLKPSNVIVGNYDGQPVPKVIDFGVAKATGQKLTDATLFTGFGTVLGTPEYMSPEQARIDNMDIDTRSDVYSLGILLYELLTGTTPLQHGRVKEAAILEVLRLVREEDPPRPSTRLSTVEQLPSIAANRGLEPRQLSSQIRGELDWIVMKALEKDRSRRYETVNGLAADLRRFLDGEPVSACPPSAGYRLRKLAQKHRRALVTVTSLATMLLVLAVGAIVWGLQADAQRRQIDEINGELTQKNSSLIELSKQERKAREEANERLREALVFSARAGRSSLEMGRRFKGLASLAEAARIRPGADIRNEAIACMSLVDLRPLNHWPLPNRKSSGAAFDTKFERFVQVLDEGGLVVQRVSDGEELTRLPSLGQFVNSWYLQFSPDGRWISVIYGLSGDLRVVVWDIAAGAIRFEVPTRNEQYVCFDRDGRLFAYRAMDGSTRIHDLNTNEEKLRIADEDLVHPTHFALHPTRPLLAVTEPGSETMKLFDIAEGGKTVDQVALGAPGRFMDWNPDGTQLAVSVERDIAVLEFPGFRRVSTLKGHQAQACFLRFHPTEKLLISDSWDDSFRVWDPHSGQQLVRGPGMCRGISADGLKVATYHKFAAQLLELAPGVEVRRLRERVGMPGNHRDVRFEAAGRLLHTSHDYGASIWDLATFDQICELPIGEAHQSLWLGTSLDFVTTGESGLLKWPVRSRPDPTVLRIGPPEPMGLPLSVFVSTLVGDRSGRTVFACRIDKQGSYVIDSIPGRVRQFVPRAFGELAISSDGRYVVCAQQYSQGEVVVRDAVTAEKVVVLPGKPAIRTSVQFTPDSSRLLVSDQERVRLYDTKDWSLLWEKPRASGVGSNFMASVSPDGYCLALLEEGVRVRLVELATGRDLAMLESATDMITDMVFAADGTRLAAMGGNLTVLLWDLHALRQGLKRLGLDWDGPPLPPPPDFSAERARGTIKAELDFGPAQSHPARSPLRLAALGIDARDIAARLAKNPNDAAALAGRGMLAAAKGNLKQAIVDLSRAIELDPKPGYAYAERARAYRSMDDDRKAAADYENALARDYDEPMLRNNLAWTYLAGPVDLRNPERALELARQAIAQNPEDPLVSNTLGVALYRTGNFAEAAKVLRDNAVRKGNGLPAFDWLFAAMAHQRLGQHEQAEAAWLQAIAGEPAVLRQGPSIVEEWRAFRSEAEPLLGTKKPEPEIPAANP